MYTFSFFRKKELMVDAEALKLATNLVTTGPFPHQGGDVWSCRTCSPVKEGRLQYEFINTSPQSVKIEAGTVLGYAEFTEEESFEATADETEMFCSYKGYHSGYETEEESDAEEDIEEIDMDNGLQAKGIPRTPNRHVHQDPKMQPKTTQGILRTSKDHAHQKTNTRNAHYLRHAPFLAITDHRPLLSWRKMIARKDPTGRLPDGQSNWTRTNLNSSTRKVASTQTHSVADVRMTTTNTPQMIRTCALWCQRLKVKWAPTCKE
jgi:hypothetical protein